MRTQPIVAALLIAGSAQASTSTEVYQALTSQFGQAAAPEACIQASAESDQVLETVQKQLIAASNNNDTTEILSALITFTSAVKMMKKSTDDCAPWNIEELNTAAKNLLSGEKVQISDEDLIINGKSVLEFAGKATEAYSRGDFREFGE